MWFRNKKKADEEPTFPYGFAVPEQPDTVCSGKGFVCFIKGILVFSAAMGTVGSVISSFSLPCDLFALTVILFVLSLIMAFLHYNKHLFNIVYPVVFVSFTYFIFTFRYMVNSGYQAFVNILQQTYGDYYLLDIYRESTEFFTDRRLTITFAAGFIGFFLILMLNIFISEYMSPAVVILITFPIFQMGMFVEKMPDQIYLIMLLFSYFMVGILRCSRHFLLPYNDKKWTEFKKEESDTVISYRYHASGRIFRQLTAVFFMFALIIGFISIPLMAGSSNNRLSRIRRNADEYMKTFTQTGLSAFFDRYSAKGGISGGKLGGVSSVRPDYQTDLTVSFVPYTYDMMYLKAYTGSKYTGNSWEKPDFDMYAVLDGSDIDPSEYERFVSTIEGYRKSQQKAKDPSVMRSRMRIQNMDAESGYYYLPYFTDPDFKLPHILDHGVIYPETDTSSLKDDVTGLEVSNAGEARGGIYAFDYYPYTQQPGSAPSEVGSGSADLARFSRLYNKSMHEEYLQIPKTIKEYLYSLHDEIGTGDDTDEIIELIRDYLYQFPYSQTPGTTPMNEDFVRYFLEEQKRGYCSHFASAGTLLLRSYGIPARYVEGYAVSLADISEGAEENADYDEWFEGENPLGRTGVVTVNVSDGSAHAWVEVYKDGIGWVPCEFTPPSEDTEQSEAYSGFWDVFSGLFSLAGRAPDTVNNQSQTREILENTSKKVSGLFSQSVFRPFILFVALTLGILILFKLTTGLYRMISMHLSWKKGNHSPRIIYHYKKLCLILKRKHLLNEDAGFLLPSGLEEMLIKNEKAASSMGYSPADLANIKELLLSCIYSPDGIAHTDAKKLLEFIIKLKKAV